MAKAQNGRNHKTAEAQNSRSTKRQMLYKYFYLY
jgi:hypothetical protein